MTYNKNKDMKIIKAKTSDLKLVVPLFDAYRVFYGQNPDMLKSEAFISARLQNEDSIIFIITNDAQSESYGFAQVYPSFSSIGAASIFILNDLYVAPEHRRKGLARRLLQHINELAAKENMAKITLETAFTNKAAQALYESLGYKQEEGALIYNLRMVNK